MTPLVATERLTGRKSLPANRTLMQLSTTAGDGGAGAGDGGIVGGRLMLIGRRRRRFAVAGLVSTERLIRREGLVTDRALVGDLRGYGGGGGGRDSHHYTGGGGGSIAVSGVLVVVPW